MSRQSMRGSICNSGGIVGSSYVMVYALKSVSRSSRPHCCGVAFLFDAVDVPCFSAFWFCFTVRQDPIAGSQLS